MNNKDMKNSQLEGPSSYENWKSYNAGSPILYSSEFELYTDTWITGEVTSGLGPYQFFNLVPIGYKTGIVRAAIVLRYSYHIEFNISEINETDSSRYHGGLPTDEIAALASLLIGCRVYAGGETREFRQGGEPAGRPVSRNFRPIPVVTTGERGFILPHIRGQHSMMPLQKMVSYSNISPKEAIILVRSARLYQDALWIAESEPNLAWLMMVSAVEVVANQRYSSTGSALERLRASKPELVSLLEETTGVLDLSQKVAEQIVDSIGSTKKFVEFLMAHLPEPPAVRPDTWAQVEWTRDKLCDVFRLIYGYRSKALHGGIPFPAPMCELPFCTRVGKAAAEKPIGLGASVYGGKWLSKDTPMNLNTFEYIARNAILKWWESLPGNML
jgi:hypothetical protein